MVGETDMLVLTDVDSDAAGTYMCMVTNEAGSSTASAELVTFGKGTLIITLHK